METITNKKFSTEDQGFITACGNVELKPTKRQASKWRRQRGLAYKKGRHSHNLSKETI